MVGKRSGRMYGTCGGHELRAKKKEKENIKFRHGYRGWILVSMELSDLAPISITVNASEDEEGGVEISM